MSEPTPSDLLDHRDDTIALFSGLDASRLSGAEVQDVLRDVTEIEASAAAFAVRLRAHLANDCHTPVVE